MVLLITVVVAHSGYILKGVSKFYARFSHMLFSLERWRLQTIFLLRTFQKVGFVLKEKRRLKRDLLGLGPIKFCS